MNTKYLLTCTLALSACNPRLDTPPELTRTVGGFHHPESALWDASSNTWFVSNVGEFETPGDGFISRLNAQGTVINSHFAADLDDPKGMAILDGQLFVADLHAVVSINLESPHHISRIEVQGSTFLNDVVADKLRKAVYVSDSFGNAIFRIRHGVVEEVIRDTGLETPNGLALRGDTLYIASIGPDPDPTTFIPSQPGRIWRLDLKTNQYEAETGRLASLDGLVVHGDEFLVTDTFVGVYHVSPEGETELYVDAQALSLAGSADIGFDPLSGTLAVPQLFGDTVSFFSFN